MAADRNNAVLVAFARDAYGPVVHVDVAAIEISEFGKAQARRIQQLEYCPVTVDERPVARNIEQPSHAVGVEVAGKPFPALGSGYRGNRILGDVLFSHEVAKKGTCCRKPALDAPCAETPPIALGRKGPDVLIVQVAPAVKPGSLTKGE
jgi:hypothetical protein